MKARSLLLVPCLLLLAGAARADDWPQWRGPDRSGVSKETGLLKTWPKEGPKLLWTYREAGVGYSSFAVVGDRLFTMGGRGDSEFVIAIDVKTGKEAWAAKVGPLFDFKGNSWGKGPRSTPCFEGGMVYALGGFGELVCVHAEDGKELWRKDLRKELGAEVNPIILEDPGKVGWGFTWSPLVDGDRLVCVPGGPQGLLAALDKKTGEVQWRSTDLPEQAPYSSPIIAEVGGVRQYIEMTYHGVAGVAAKDGKLLWHYKRAAAYNDVLIPTPIFHDNLVFITNGMGTARGVGCDLVRLTATDGSIKATKVYANQNLEAKMGQVVLVNGHVYGWSASRRVPGWVCLDFKTGKPAWNEAEALGPGSVIAADGNLYCYGEEDGVAALVEATAEKYTEKGRFEIPEKTKERAPSGKVWTPPVVANGHLYLRDQELIFCYDVKAR